MFWQGELSFKGITLELTSARFYGVWCSASAIAPSLAAKYVELAALVALGIACYIMLLALLDRPYMDSILAMVRPK